MKIAVKKRALFLMIISVLVISCTLPFYVGANEPEEKTVYIEVTSTPVGETDDDSADMEDETEDPAPTPTVSVNLDGDWTIWFGIEEEELNINFLQQGYKLTANAATGGNDSILFSGTINHDGDEVEGNWESTDGSQGNFTIFLESDLFSFTGNLGGGVAFCGVRGSTDKPTNCLE